MHQGTLLFILDIECHRRLPRCSFHLQHIHPRRSLVLSTGMDPTHLDSRPRSSSTPFLSLEERASLDCDVPGRHGASRDNVLENIVFHTYRIYICTRFNGGKDTSHIIERYKNTAKCGLCRRIISILDNVEQRNWRQSR
jgi:hypothetical protein